MGELLEKVYDFDNLMRAFKKAACCRRHKKDVIKFELRLTDNLWKIHYALKNDTYNPNGYRRFIIYEPKEREIQALPFIHRVLQTSLCVNGIRDFFERRLIYDCAACRPNKGTHFAINRLNKFMRSFYKQHKTNGYFLKIDVKKYFDSIAHDVLKDKIKIFPDKDILSLLYRIIDSYSNKPNKGIPMGNQTSQWFALFYLDSVDRLIKEKLRIKYYSRYMDDLILIHHSKDYLKYCLEEITKMATNELKLEFNNKTQIFPISQGVDYMGFRFYLSKTGKVIRKLRTSNKKRFKRKMKAFVKKYYDGEMTFDDINRSVQSYNGHLKHGHTFRLRRHVFNKMKLISGKYPEVSEDYFYEDV